MNTVTATNLNQLDMTSREEVLQAHSQLLSVIVGKSGARDTSSMREDPLARTRKCVELTIQELKLATDLEEASERTKRMKQVQRKLDSLESLTTFANLINEVIFDE